MIADGLVCAYILDGTGNARTIGWDEIQARQPGSPGALWVHIDRAGAEAKRWLEQDSGVDDVVVEQLLADVSRPRLQLHGEGLLVNLRGVNLNPGADPEDMVSVKIWADPEGSSPAGTGT